MMNERAHDDMVSLGVDRLLDDPTVAVPDGRLGLITNPSGVNEELRSTLDLLAERTDMDLRAAFGPEHGVRGDKQAGVEYGDGVDEATGTRIRSLYGDTRRIQPEQIRDIDILLCDIQGIGCRFYTYLYTLAYALEGAAGTDTELVVLDRPNPIAPLGRDGNRVPDEHANFVSGYRLPIIHRMTIGELAGYFNGEFDIGADLSVVELDGWDRETWYDETDLYWVQPSPNIPTLSAALLYPGTCLFEGTNLSEGRGTTTPFELVGAPWIDPHEFAGLLNGAGLPGVRFRPVYFTPSFSKHEGDRAGGVKIHIDDRSALSPVQIGLTTLITAFQEYPQTEWRTCDGADTIDRLAGGPELRERIDASSNDPFAVCEAIRASWKSDTTAFERVCERYRRY